MPPKGGKKRKSTPTSAPSSSAPTTNGNGHTTSLTPPDRETWPGWVEMESEPAFFNVMLNEMGVQGVKVQEVYDMDDGLMFLPQPVHALIFLFRYKEDVQQQKSDSCPKEVWFANQTPDFACATFALLNIVNNIPGLHLGTGLQKFKDFTEDMDPLSRGDAIDDFSFVKRIHNSFARDNDILQADMYMKNKAAKFKKRQAILKANATKAAKKAELASSPTAPPKKTPPKAPQQTRSGRTTKPTSKKSPRESTPAGDSDEEYSVKPHYTPGKPVQPTGVRRSARAPKPRIPNPVSAAADDGEDEDGFHFVAYMPIAGNVWKLDGLDRFPQIVGPFEEGGPGWMHVAQPHLVGRMAQYATEDIQFNLMGVVHDPLIGEKKALVENVRMLQVVEKRLDVVFEDWRSMDDAKADGNVIVTCSPELNITLKDVAAVEVDAEAAKVEGEENLLKLTELRKGTILQQSGLRAAVRDSLQATKGDEEKARHRRHDYGSFVRGWLGALAEQEMLTPLMEE